MLHTFHSPALQKMIAHQMSSKLLEADVLEDLSSLLTQNNLHVRSGGVLLQGVQAVVTLNETFEVFITTEQYEVSSLTSPDVLASQLSSWKMTSPVYGADLIPKTNDGSIW